MKNENNNNDSEHPRIDSLQALLRFAVQQTKSEDAPHDSAFEKMDPERRKFLEDALKNWNVDIIKELEKAVSILESSESTMDEKLQSLEMIEELAGDIDLANNFLKIGGSRIIVSCLDSNDSRIRSSAIEIIGEITQNNPFAQAHFTEIDIIPKLITLLIDEDCNVIRNTMHAISCLVRRYEPALAVYVEKDGLEMILNCMNSNNLDEKLLVKGSFLIDALSIEFSEVREQFIKLEAIDMLGNFLKTSIESYQGDYNAKIEHLLSALKTLSESNKAKNKIKSVVNLENTLKTILDLCQSKEECEEIINHSQYLLTYIMSESTVTIAQRAAPSHLQVSLWQDRTNPNPN